MFAALKRRWARFLAAPSGTRFQAHYRRQHERLVWRTLLSVGAGLVLIAVGVLLLVLPGPGLLLVAIGAALLAGESLTVARGLDALELRITPLWRRWRARYGGRR